VPSALVRSSPEEIARHFLHGWVKVGAWGELVSSFFAENAQHQLKEFPNLKLSRI